jgi:hypothetical protein
MVALQLMEPAKTGSGKQLKWVGLIALAVAGMMLLVYAGKAWSEGHESPPAYTKMYERAQDPWNLGMIDSGLHMIRTGDLVVRTGGDVTSYMLSQLNLTDKTYSHCGLVIIENGYPFVYHSIGGEDNPNEYLRRDSASFWFSPLHNLGYGIVRYDVDSAQIARLSEVVRSYYHQKKKFDLDFDLASNDKLYCAEFAYKALNEAMADTNYVRPHTMFGFRYVAVDNLFVNPHAHLICQIQFK